MKFEKGKGHAYDDRRLLRTVSSDECQWPDRREIDHGPNSRLRALQLRLGEATAANRRVLLQRSAFASLSTAAPAWPSVGMSARPCPQSYDRLVLLAKHLRAQAGTVVPTSGNNPQVRCGDREA